MFKDDEEIRIKKKTLKIVFLAIVSLSLFTYSVAVNIGVVDRGYIENKIRYTPKFQNVTYETSYIIIVNGHNYSVSSSDYYSVNVGDYVKVYLGSNTYTAQYHVVKAYPFLP